jgi:hypothetical protein
MKMAFHTHLYNGAWVMLPESTVAAALVKLTVEHETGEQAQSFPKTVTRFVPVFVGRLQPFRMSLVQGFAQIILKAILCFYLRRNIVPHG